MVVRSMLSASSIDLSDLSDETLDALAAGIDRVRLSRALDLSRSSERGHRSLLDNASDEEIIAAAAAYCRDGAPITLANRYDRVDWHQNIGGFALDHPRRPVIMKGGLHLLIRQHCRTPGGTSPNGWAGHVLARAVRMSRATIFDADEYDAFIAPLAHKMRERYRLTSAFDDLSHRVGCGYFRNTALIRGRFVELNASEMANVKALYAIIRKTEKLEARRQAALDHMRERLAA